MSYKYSNLDNRLKKWFKADYTNATLHKINLAGQIRSLKNLDIELDFPITAVAGKNGCGKTTILALVACAYHNKGKDFKISNRRKPYYTFSDFFIQTQEEIKHDGIVINNQFLHNNWSNLADGYGWQFMRKRKGGKWTNYEKRINKNVLYLGIERVVPQTEKKVYKSHLKYFRDEEDSGWYTDVQSLVGKILDKNYSNFKVQKSGLYNMQYVKETGVMYSGFNMGAGEKALFELFSIIHQCSSKDAPSLLVIDEIELGLHEVAQRNLIKVLKEICQKHRLQIICTTHAPAILDSLPPEGRFYIDKVGTQTIITKGISGAFAAGRLSDNHSNELDILVEDVVAQTLISSTLDLESRQRVGILPIGSHAAVCRQLGAAYRHPKLKEKTIAILDGDQIKNRNEIIKSIASDLEISTAVEHTKFNEWIKNKIYFLPGSSSPEKWIIETSLKYIDKNFAERLGTKLNTLKLNIEGALEQNAHEEFYYISKKLLVSEDSILLDLCRLIASKNVEELKTLQSILKEFLQDF